MLIQCNFLQITLQISYFKTSSETRTDISPYLGFGTSGGRVKVLYFEIQLTYSSVNKHTFKN